MNYYLKLVSHDDYGAVPGDGYVIMDADTQTRVNTPMRPCLDDAMIDLITLRVIAARNV